MHPYSVALYCTAADAAAVETALRRCAKAAVDRHVSDGDVVGVASGAIVSYVLEEIAERLNDGALNVRAVQVEHSSLTPCVESARVSSG